MARHVGDAAVSPERARRCDDLIHRVTQLFPDRFEDEAIADAVRMQRDAGMRTATDGGIRRSTWHPDFIDAIAGISRVDGEGRPVHVENADGTVDGALPAEGRPDLLRAALRPADPIGRNQ